MPLNLLGMKRVKQRTTKQHPGTHLSSAAHGDRKRWRFFKFHLLCVVCLMNKIKADQFASMEIASEHFSNFIFSILFALLRFYVCERERKKMCVCVTIITMYSIITMLMLTLKFYILHIVNTCTQPHMGTQFICMTVYSAVRIQFVSICTTCSHNNNDYLYYPPAHHLEIVNTQCKTPPPNSHLLPFM